MEIICEVSLENLGHGYSYSKIRNISIAINAKPQQMIVEQSQNVAWLPPVVVTYISVI